jgi:hypothetical protein
VIVSRRPGTRLDAKISRDDATERRVIRPRAMQILKKGSVDLVEYLIASPTELDD